MCSNALFLVLRQSNGVDNDHNSFRRFKLLGIKTHFLISLSIDLSSVSDVISQASSGRRSAAYSNIYGDRLTRQGSIINSERASVASGSLTSGGLAAAAATDQTNTAELTPQQIGVMGE